jgi:hypothetical protein
LHAGGIQAPRFRGKLANLANRQFVQRSSGRLLRNKRLMMIDQLFQVRQGGTFLDLV